MNCYHVTVVDCLTVASHKIQHDSNVAVTFSNSTYVFPHCRALTVNLQKVFYNSRASVGDKQSTIILFISILVLPTIFFCRILAPPAPTILNYRKDRERGRHYVL